MDASSFGCSIWDNFDDLSTYVHTEAYLNNSVQRLVWRGAKAPMIMVLLVVEFGKLEAAKEDGNMLSVPVPVSFDAAVSLNMFVA